MPFPWAYSSFFILSRPGSIPSLPTNTPIHNRVETNLPHSNRLAVPVYNHTQHHPHLYTTSYTHTMKFSATSRAAPPAPLDFTHSQYNTPGSPDSSRPHSGDYTLSFPDSRRPNKGIPVEQATAAFAFTLSPTGLVRVPFKRRAERERRIISMAPTEISSTDSRVGFAPDSFFLAFCYMHTASSSMFDSRISSLQLPKVQLCFTTPSVW